MLAGRSLVGGSASGDVLSADVPLSFWGGVDPLTGTVLDRHHPLRGRTLAGRVLAIPGGRGSCSGSNVLLELILNGHAPAALVFSQDESILTLGVIIAEEMFDRTIPVLVLCPEDFAVVAAARHARVTNEAVEVGETPFVAAAPGRAPVRAEATTRLRLTEADRAVLAGQDGKAAETAMRIVLRMADIQGASELIDVSKAHIDGCIYTGPASLRFAEQLRDWGAKVRVPTTLNAISVDERRWREQGVEDAVARPAVRLAEAYVGMGARPSFTCAPYLLDGAPERGEQIVWSESNAVVFANSVIGARTAKYPDYLDICIALTGRAPLADCHVDANRRAAVVIELADLGPFDDALYPLLGYHVGTIAANEIPVVTGLETAFPTRDDLKAFGAGFATTSAASMFHIAGVTPEARTVADALLEGEARRTVRVGRGDLLASWQALNVAEDAAVDLVSLGNPHFSLTECARTAELTRGRHKHADVALIVTCGRDTHEKAVAGGFVAELERFGARFVNDACWCTIREPVFPRSARTLMTNSAKYAHYGPGLVGRPVRFGSLQACIDAACTGQAREDAPPWLAR